MILTTAFTAALLMFARSIGDTTGAVTYFLCPFVTMRLSPSSLAGRAEVYAAGN